MGRQGPGAKHNPLVVAHRLNDAGRLDEALILLRECGQQAQSPEERDKFQYAVGDFLCWGGRCSEARREYHQIVARRASRFAGLAQLTIATCHYERGELRQGIHALRKLLRAFPDSPQAITGVEALSMFLEQLGQHEDAKQLLQDYAATIEEAKASSNPMVQFLALGFDANRHEDAGRLDEAIRCMELQLRIAEQHGFTPAIHWLRRKLRGLRR